MFLPSSEWRPVSAAPAVWSSQLLQVLCVPDWRVLFAMILGVACTCFLTFCAKETCLSAGLYRSGSRYSISNLWFYRINRAGKSTCL